MYVCICSEKWLKPLGVKPIKIKPIQINKSIVINKYEPSDPIIYYILGNYLEEKNK